MKAAVLHGFGDLRVEEVPDPHPGPDDVVIEVVCVQPSVTECMLIAGDDIAMHAALVRRLERGPTQFGGHEFAGVVRVSPAIAAPSWHPTNVSPYCPYPIPFNAFCSIISYCGLRTAGLPVRGA